MNVLISPEVAGVGKTDLPRWRIASISEATFQVLVHHRYLQLWKDIPSPGGSGMPSGSGTTWPQPPGNCGYKWVLTRKEAQFMPRPDTRGLRRAGSREWWRARATELVDVVAGGAHSSDTMAIFSTRTVRCALLVVTSTSSMSTLGLGGAGGRSPERRLPTPR